jgi:hypothetical protein
VTEGRGQRQSDEPGGQRAVIDRHWRPLQCAARIPPMAAGDRTAAQALRPAGAGRPAVHAGKPPRVDRAPAPAARFGVRGDLVRRGGGRPDRRRPRPRRFRRSAATAPVGGQVQSFGVTSSNPPRGPLQSRRSSAQSRPAARQGRQGARPCERCPILKRMKSTGHSGLPSSNP